MSTSTLGMSEREAGPDPKNFSCRRPYHTNPRLYEFQRYLELTGVTKALGQALGSLYTENPRPMDPMRYIVQKMSLAGKVAKWSECVTSLRNELTELRILVMYAQSENGRFRAFLGLPAEDEKEVVEELIPVRKKMSRRKSMAVNLH